MRRTHHEAEPNRPGESLVSVKRSQPRKNDFAWTREWRQNSLVAATVIRSKALKVMQEPRRGRRRTNR